MGFSYAWGIGVEQWDFSGFVQPGMSVYDIGANCGQSTLHLAMLVGKSGRVVAFEPVESLFKNLVFNLELNSLFQVTPYALPRLEGWPTPQFLKIDVEGGVISAYYLTGRSTRTPKACARQRRARSSIAS